MIIETGQILTHPSDILTRLGDVSVSSSSAAKWGEIYEQYGIDLEVKTIPLNTQTVEMTCVGEGNHPEMEVVWIKDGTRVWKAPPPRGFTYIISKASTLGALSSQGYYHCEMWSDHPFQKMVSKSALVKFAGI